MRLSLLHHRRVRRHYSQIWRFLVCGGTGFMLDMSSLALFVEVLGIDARIAVILSSCIGAVFVFLANKFFTFRNREPAGRQFLRFVVVYGISIVFNALLSNLLLWLGVQYLLAKMIAIGIGIIWNYLLSHGFIFRRKKEEVDVVVT